MINSDFNRQVVAAGAPIPDHRWVLYTAFFIFHIYEEIFFYPPSFRWISSVGAANRRIMRFLVPEN
jgi:hypothetical protein